jgi:glycosidase
MRAVAALAMSLLLVVGCGPSAPTVGPSGGTGQGASAAPTGAPSAAPSAAACPVSRPAAADRPWWADRVFYEVFVRSFADSDGDGIGDLRGLTERLDYLNDGDPGTTADLGVTALWLMPVAASPSYHGYDVTDYRMVEPDYGTNEDFKTLVAAAKERGIEVIVDLVMNHTSVEHPWFQDARTPGSAHDAWYVWSDSDPGYGGPAGPVWHRDGDRYYYGYFWEGMPDLDLTNAAVTAEMDGIARFWTEEMGAAGFRLDAARHLIEDGPTLENTPATFAWLEGFRSGLHATAPSALLVGEVWDSTANAARYVADGALDMAFEFGLASAILSAIRLEDAESLGHVQAEVTAAYPAAGYGAFLTNHDQDRVMDVLGRDPAAARQAATLLLTNPGVPFIYYGEEVGLRGRKPDEEIRTPLPWTAAGPGYGFTTGEPWEPVAPGVETANVAAQTDDPRSLLSWYRTLIGLRAAHPALATGDLVPVEASSPSVYAYLRHDRATGDAILVVSNLADAETAGVTLTLPSGPLCGTPRATVVLGEATVRPPAVNPAGGFDAWVLGDLAGHEDLVVDVSP